MKARILIALLGLALPAFAQKPSDTYRLPLTPDMPEWAKLLYRDDVAVNLFDLDAQFQPWKLTFDSLKTEMARSGDSPAPELIQQFEYYKKYYKYYTRWRTRVYPYVLPDGSLDFSISRDKDYFSEPSNLKNQGSEKMSGWNFVGPVVTRWRQNDNAAQPLMPSQVNIYSMDVAPSDPNTLYVGSETGVVSKTTDKGLSWTEVGSDFFSEKIGAIAIHPTDPNTVYISELGNRIVSTSDGGATWSTVLTISNFNCEDIKIKPDDPEVVLAAGTSLRRRTTGNIWTNVLNMRAYDVAFKPDNPSVVYALVRNSALDLCEFWKSTDGGQTWSIRSTGWITGLTDGGGRITVTPANNNRIYCALLTGSGPRIMRSDDAGETWTIIAASNETGLIGPCTSGPLSMTNGQGYYDLSIVASHSNADQIIVGTTTSFKSTDGGVNYTPLGGYCGPFQTHPDIQELMAKGTDTWMVTDGGVNLSTDFFTDPTVGVNYHVRINNLRGSEHWGFDSGWNEDVLVGGRYHNGNTAWRETYPAGDFLRMGGGEAATGYVNPGNPSLNYFSDLGGRILPVMNNQPVGSFTVTKWPNEGFFPMEGAEQKWDPRYMYTYYLGNGNQFWKTTNNGLTFTALFTHSDANAKIRYVEVSRSNPDVIYFTVQIGAPSANDGQLWKTTNGGATWTQCANPGTLTASQRRLSKITMSGTDANTLWWCFRTGPNGQKVFKSVNGGASWTNWTTSALDNLSATDILHQLGTDGGVYFLTGTGSKVLYRDNTASDWTIYQTGLPLDLYGDFQGPLAKAFYKGGKLRLGTGDGIWEADLYTSSTTTLVQPMADNPAPGCSRDTIQLESYSVVRGNATYQWSLSPAPQWISNPNIRNPRVVLGTTAGSYAVMLTVTDDNGVTSRTINNMLNNLPSGNLCGTDTIPGKSLVLSGSGDYAQPSANLNLNSNTVSITAWVKRNGAQVDFAGLVYARGGTTSAGLSITSGNALRYTWNDAAGSYGFNTGFIIPDNTWTHIAMVISPTAATIYMNGRPSTRTAAHPAEAFDTPVKIGYDNGSRYFKGEVDEVAVWNKSLTQNEIRELMHHTLNPANHAELVSYYQFNEVSGTAYDKVSTRHVSLIGNTARVVSTGPFGGGKSARQNVTSAGLKTFTGTDVQLAFPAAGPYPNGEIVVSRINLSPDSLPACSAYASDNHYWIIENFGSNVTFAALDSMRLGNIAVPASNAIPPGSYRLNRRSIAAAVAGTANGKANGHKLPWTLQAGTSIGASGGTGGRITFGPGSGITEFGQFTATNSLSAQIITGPAAVCSGGNVTLDAGAGYTMYSWSNGGGNSQTANFSNLTATTTFTVTVTDANGCTGEAIHTVIVNTNPTPEISGSTSVCSVGSAVLDAGAGYTTYAWSNSGGSGQTASFSNLIATTTFTVTVTNANGCTGTDTHLVTVNSNPTPSITGPASVCSGGSVALDAGAGYTVYAWSNSGGSGQTASFSNLTSTTTFSVTVTDANGCTGTDTQLVIVDANPTPAITGPASVCAGGSAVLDAGAGYTTYAWSNSGGSGQTASFSNLTSTTTFTVTVTNANSCTGTGTHTVTVNSCSGDILISGMVKWENNNAPVKSVNVGLNTLPGLSLVDSDVTGSAGTYLLVTPSGSDFRILPTKNINLLNGVTSADATRIQQHISNNPPLPGPYKRIAADVNKSNTITTYDAQLITQAIAGNPAALLVFNTSWRSVPESYVFPNPNIPWGFPEKIDLYGVSGNLTDQNFIGVKIGDVNGTANPQLKPGAPLTLAVADRTIEAGETAEVFFTVRDFSDIAAYQVAISFDTSVMQLTGAASAGTMGLTADNLGTFNASNGEVRVVWNTDVGKTCINGDSVFSFTFKGLQSGKKLSEILQIDLSNIAASAWNTELFVTDINLVFVDEDTHISGTAALPERKAELYQNIPNPFTGSVLIGFSLPESCDARLRIIDMNGRIVTELNKTYTAGDHQEVIQLPNVSGFLFYELTTPFGTYSRKMTAAE